MRFGPVFGGHHGPAPPMNALHIRSILDEAASLLYHSRMNEWIAFSLIHAAHNIESRLEDALATVNLSGPKFAALSVLVSEEQPLSLSELAEKLTCVRSNVTQLVDRLEADGLAKRIDDPSDRRGVKAEVTKLGRERHAAGAKVANKVHEEVRKKLSAVDTTALQRALDAIE
jgi:DNA-binding MarR family transcriptional regulator